METKEEEAQIKHDAQEEIQRRQNMGKMDIWSEKQATLPPAISKLKGFMIEMSFVFLTIYPSRFREGEFNEGGGGAD